MMQELAQNLIVRGWNVTVITGFPNHPSGVNSTRIFKKMGFKRETYNGVRICRIWTLD